MPLEIERIYTWTDEDVTDILDRARAVVETLEMPEDLRQPAFEKAVQMLSHHNAIPKGSGLALPEGMLSH